MYNTTTVEPADVETGPRHVSGEGESMTAGDRSSKHEGIKPPMSLRTVRMPPSLEFGSRPPTTFLQLVPIEFDPMSHPTSLCPRTLDKR
jgi:hypothetical protein